MQLKHILALLSITSETVVTYTVFGCHHRRADPESLFRHCTSLLLALKKDGLGVVKSGSRTTLFYPSCSVINGSLKFLWNCSELAGTSVVGSGSVLG